MLKVSSNRTKKMFLKTRKIVKKGVDIRYLFCYDNQVAEQERVSGEVSKWS